MTVYAMFVVIAAIAMATGVFSNAISNDSSLDRSSKQVRYPHECLCQQYYDCSHGEKVLQNCSQGMLFDLGSDSCVAYDAADFNHCEDLLPFARKCPSDGVSTLPHETDCTLYYRCHNGRKILQHCKGGLYFDYLKGLCMWNDLARCAPNMGLNSCPTSGSRSLPHPCLCDRYYKCVDGAPILQMCPPGLQFDYINEICDDPRNFECVRPIPEIPTNSTTTQTPTTPATTQRPTTPTTTQSPTTPTTTQSPTTPTTTQSPTTPTTTQSPTTPTTTQSSTTPTTTQSPTTPTTTQSPTTPTTTQSPTTPTTTQSPTTPTTTQSPTTPTTTQTPTTSTTTQTPTTSTSTQTPTTPTTTQSPTTPTTTQTPTTSTTTQTPTTSTTTQTPTTSTTTQTPTTPTTTQSPTTPTTTQSPTTPTTTQTPTTSTTTQTPTTSTTTQTPTTPTTTQSPTTPTTTQSPTTPTTTQTPTTSTTTQTPTTPTTTQSPTTSTTTETPTTISPDCPINCTEKVYLPNPADCSSYYECYRGRKKLLRCSTGLRFNKITKTCDWSWNVVC